MWDLPGPGHEPVSPALAGGFLTTAPPGKPRAFLIICIIISFIAITFNVQGRDRTYQKSGGQQILYPVQKITSDIVFHPSAFLAHNLVLIYREKKSQKIQMFKFY